MASGEEGQQGGRQMLVFIISHAEPFNLKLCTCMTLININLKKKSTKETTRK